MVLNARGAVFHGMFIKANELFAAGRFDDCEHYCRQLLSYADLGDYHKAWAHLILSYGSDEYVWHAEQAVEIFENLFTVRPGSSWHGGVPTAMHLQLQRENLDLARKSLAKAEKDHEAIRKDYEAQLAAFRESHHREPTDAELATAHFERHRTTEDDEYLSNLDDKWHEHLRAEPTEGEQDEDTEDEDINEDFFAETFSSSQLSEMHGPVRGGLGHYESSPPTSAVSDVEANKKL